MALFVLPPLYLLNVHSTVLKTLMAILKHLFSIVLTNTVLKTDLCRCYTDKTFLPARSFMSFGYKKRLQTEIKPVKFLGKRK